MRKTILVILIFIGQNLMAQKPYRGAEYRTIQAFTYGKFEVRMRSAQLSGMLSSFFTYHEISGVEE
ncbi:b-glucosidase, partial [candidate division KSB1 bacterium]